MILRTILILLLVISNFSFCEIRLPKLISDGMVLQRDANLKIWSWASDGEKVAIHFIGSTYHTILLLEQTSFIKTS